MHPAAAQSLFVNKPDDFGRFVVFSLVGHVGLLAAFLVLGGLFGGAVIDLDQKPIHASLIRKGTPRDAKLLPRKDEPPPPPKASEGATAPVVKPAEPQPSGRSGLLDALNKAQRKPGTSDGDARRQLFGAFNKVSKTAHDVEGDPNGDPNGDSSTQEGERYYGVLNAQVRRYYDVSQTIPESERAHLHAVAAIRLDPQGRLVSAQITKSSNNALFDQAVLAALKKASPFPPPPDNLRAQLQRGLAFDFVP